MRRPWLEIPEGRMSRHATTVSTQVLAQYEHAHKIMVEMHRRIVAEAEARGDEVEIIEPDTIIIRSRK